MLKSKPDGHLRDRSTAKNPEQNNNIHNRNNYNNNKMTISE